MKVVVVFALVASAIAASSVWESPKRANYDELADIKHFQQGRQYRFLYNGQISTGLPETSDQHAATRVQADVHVLFTEATTATLQIKQFRMASLNKELPEPREVQPFGAFDEQNVETDLQTVIRLPVRFRYESGIVSDLEFDGEDKPWSANIKRAILNMMHVNLRKTGRNDLVELARIAPEEDAERAMDKPLGPDYFVARERSLEGNCDTTYTMVPKPSYSRKPTDSDVYTIEKSINFEKCQERADIRYNFRFGERCETCEKKYAGSERNTQSSTIISLNVTGNAERFIIREVELRSQYVLAPLNEKVTRMATYVAARLQLLGEQKKTVEQPTKVAKKETILFSAAWDAQKELFHMEGEAAFSKKTPYTEVKNKPEAIKKIVDELATLVLDKQNEKGVRSEAPRLMARLVKMIRMCDESEIRRVHNEIFEVQEHKKMRELMAEAMAMAGTKHSIDHLVEKIIKKQVSPYKAAHIIKTLVNVRTVSEQHVNAVLRVCESQVARENGPLRQSCWLTAGAMMNAMCAPNEDVLALEYEQPERRLCPLALKQKFVERIMQLFKSAETRYEKVLALKTLANAGIDVSIIELEKLIREPRRESRAVRIAAIEALRLLRAQMPRKIQNILLPLFKNTREHPDVRAQALYIIMQTQPERSVLEQIVMPMWKEPARQLKMFTFGMLHGYANSTNPCEKRLAQDVQIVLRSVHTPELRSMYDSRYARTHIYSDFYQTGATLDLAALFSNDSFLPKELSAALESVFAGSWTKQFAQVGIQQHGIDELLEKALRLIGDKTVDEIVVRGRRAASSDSSYKPIEMLRSLVQKLNIRGRRTQSSEDAHAMIYIRFRDFDYALLPIDEQTLPQIVKDVLKNGRIELSELERVLAEGFRFDTAMATFFYEAERKIATSMGMPLRVSAKMPTVATIEGQLKVELEPKNGEKVRGLKLRIIAKPSISATHVTKMEIWTPVHNTGVKMLHHVQSTLPVDMTVELTAEQKIQFKAVVKAPEQRRRIVKLQTRPVSFVRVWPKSASRYVEAEEKTIYIEQNEREARAIESTWGERATGLRFETRGHVHRKLMAAFYEGTCPLPALTGENLVELWVSPAEKDAPREFVLRAEASVFEQTRMEKPADFDNFFDFDFEKTPRKQQLKKMNNKKANVEAESDSVSQEEYNEQPEGRFFEVESSEYEQTKTEEKRRAAFSAYTKTTGKERAYKQRFWTKLEATGSSVDRFAEFEFTLVCDERAEHCRVEANVQRTPVSPIEQQRLWRLKAEAEALFPESVQSMRQLKEREHREAHARFDVEWGTELQYNIRGRVQAEQNKEQQQWLARADKEISRRDLPALVAFERLRDAAQLNQLKMVVQHSVSPIVNTYANLGFEMMKAKNWWQTRYLQPVQPLEQGKIAVRMTVDPATRRYLNITVETPEQIARMEDILMPIRITAVHIRRSEPIRNTNDFIERVMPRQNAECTVNTRKIQTFDEVIYKAPITTCWSVLAQDCWSESTTPRFTVLLKKQSKQSEEKTLRVVTPSHVVEVEQTADEKLIIKINGKVERDEQKLSERNVYSLEKHVKIELNELVVLFDGYSVKLRMSARMQNAQCGLCGHYDGERDNELRRADNTITDDVKNFHESYLHRENCQLEENELERDSQFELYSREHPIYKSASEESNESIESSEESAELDTINKKTRQQWTREQNDYPTEKIEKMPVKRTHVIEYNHRVCFSKEAVAECPRRTMPHEQKQNEKKIKFACVERSQPEALKLTRLARQQVLDMTAYPDSFVEVIKVPQLCVAY